MKKKNKWTTKRRFAYHVGQLERMILKHIGKGNYASKSSLHQLDCIYDKFMECAK